MNENHYFNGLFMRKNLCYFSNVALRKEYYYYCIQSVCGKAYLERCIVRGKRGLSYNELALLRWKNCLHFNN